MHLVLAITSPTAFLDVNKTPSLILALDHLRSIGPSLPITVAVGQDYSASVRDIFKGEKVDIEVLDCEPTNARSFAEALAPMCVDIDSVMIHDASRPLVGQAQFEGVLAAFTDDVDAVRPTMPFTETLKILDSDSVIKETLDRSSVLRISTPELIRVFAIDIDGPDSGWFLPLIKGARTTYTEGSPEGLRINTTADRDLMELHQI